MASKQRRIRGISPHISHGSILERSVYRNVADKRSRFHNDEKHPDASSAIEFLDRIWPLYRVAELYAAIKYPRREVLPSSLPQKQKQKHSLFWFQMFRPDFRLSDSPRDVTEVRREADELARDGMLPAERRIIAWLEAQLGEPISRPIGEETLQFNKSLQPSERYRVLDQYFSQTGPTSLEKRRASVPFLKRQHLWRGQQSFNACQALHLLDRDLQRKSPLELSKFEARYHAASLPHYDVLPLVGTQTARLAICIASVEPITKSSWLYKLDLVQAALVARKYNAFLAAQNSTSGRKGGKSTKHLILKRYTDLL